MIELITVLPVDAKVEVKTIGEINVRQIMNAKKYALIQSACNNQKTGCGQKLESSIETVPFANKR